MSSEWDAPVRVKRKPRWLRWLLWISGSLLVLLFIGYFVATSAWCLKRIVLPRVSEAVHATVTVDDASVSPFSSVVLRGLKVQPRAGAEPLVTIAEVEARYSLFDIIGGNINVSSIVLRDPIIQLVENADGTSNLDPLLDRPPSEKPPESGSKENTPLQLFLGQLEIRNATVRRIKLRADGGRDLAELGALNLTVSNIGNDRSGSVTLTTEIRADQLARGESSPGTNLLQAELSTTGKVALTSDLKPKSLSGEITLDVSRIPAALGEYAGLGLSVHCDLTPTDLEQFSLVVKQRRQTLVKINARGPLELARQEGRIKIEIGGLDRNALNLVGAKLGIDFGDTGISSTNEVVWSEAGQSISVSGGLNVNRLSATRAADVSPLLDLQLEYLASLNRTEHTLQLKKFMLGAAQNAAPFLRGTLTKPTTIALGATSNAVTESAFRLAVTNLNLADWKSLIGDYAGLLSLNLDLAVQKAGRRLDLDLATDLKGLSIPLGTNRVAGADLTLRTQAQVDDFARLHLISFHGMLQHQQQPCVTLLLSGDYDTRTENADLQVQLELALPQLFALAPPSLARIHTGHLILKAHALQKPVPDQRAKPGLQPAFAQTLTGELQLKNLGAVAGDLALDQFNLNLNWDTGFQGGLLQIRKLAGELARAETPGGRFDVHGTYEVSKQAADLTLELEDLNQAVLGALAQPSLQGKTLKSLSLGTHLALKYSPAAESSVNGTLQITNVLIDDPTGQWPKVPLAVDLKLDAGLLTNLATVRELTARLRVSDAPGCAFTTSGEYNLAKRAGRISLNLAELNEHALRPLAAAALGDKTLQSVAVTADLNAAFDAAGESSLRGRLAFKNLLVIDPQGALPGQPLAASIQIDGSLAQQVASLRKLELQLSPTARANNLLTLTGRVDFAKSNALNGQWLLASESFDLTPYYDLFAGHPASNHVTTITNAPPAPKPVEPPAVHLPVEQLMVGLNVSRLFLREVAVRDWRTQIKVERSRVVVKPFDLVLNGAAVRAQADLNLGVPGYEYTLALATEKIPVEPLVNTFAPESRDQFRGDLLADVQIKGAGITDPSLQKNLGGQFALQFTNGNLQLTGPRAQTFLQPIALLLNAPELLNSPLNSLAARGQIGAGRITVPQLLLASDTFTATTAGEVRLAEVLMDSALEEWPIHLAVQRSIAQRISLVPQNTPPGATYVNLPDFLRVGGTVGEPKPLLHKKALADAAVDQLKDKVLKDKLRLPGLSKPGAQSPSAPGSAPTSLPSAPTTPAPTTPTLPSTPTFNPFPLLR